MSDIDFTQHMSTSAQKYSALRIISVIFKVLAVLAAIIAVVVSLFSLGASGPRGFGGLGIAFVSILYGAFICLYFLALSEAILVFLDIEENTRLSNELLTKLLNR